MISFFTFLKQSPKNVLYIIACFILVFSAILSLKGYNTYPYINKYLQALAFALTAASIIEKRIIPNYREFKKVK